MLWANHEDTESQSHQEVLCLRVFAASWSSEPILLDTSNFFSTVQTMIFRHCEGALALARSNPIHNSKIDSPPKGKIGGSQ